MPTMSSSATAADNGHDKDDQAHALTFDRGVSPNVGTLGPDAKVGLGGLASSGPARPVLVCSHTQTMAASFL